MNNFGHNSIRQRIRVPFNQNSLAVSRTGFLASCTTRDFILALHQAYKRQMVCRIPPFSDSFRRVAAAVALAIFCASTPAADMTLLGTHPTSPLIGVPDLNILKAYDGRIYMGHGEWNGYHVIVVACYNPATHAIESEHVAPTDSIGIFRELGGKLYIPSTDPVHYDEFGDYCVLDRGIWKNFAPAGLFHAFDMATLTGSDLWMVGSKSDSETSTRRPAVFRSVDGGR